MLNNLKNKTMKNMFGMLMLASFMFTACSNSTETQTENVTESVDSTVVDSTVESSPAVDSTLTIQ
jgi:uncharacterized lipoprotein YajG